jgi:hypothetical protein
VKESGIPHLAIPKPAATRGHAFFPSQDVAAQMRLPNREFLSEYAQLRSKAERMKRWAEHRLAKETASGKADAPTIPLIEQGQGFVGREALRFVNATPSVRSDCSQARF